MSDKPNAPYSAGLYRAGMFDLGAGMARILPLGVLRALAGLFGSLYALSHAARVAVVRRNLELLDGSMGEETARGVYREFAKTLADYFYIGTRPAEEAARIVTKVEGHEELQAIQTEGKGALVVTAHFGLFELGALLMAQEGISAAVITYPEPTRELTEWRAAFRQRWQAETIEVGRDSFAFLEVAAHLRQGKFVATLIDRPHPTDSTPVSLPNGTAHFSAGILLLAAHVGVPVVPALIARQADGSYHSHVFPAIRVEERGSRAETLRFYSQQIADRFAPVLCAYPEQWYQFVPLRREA